MRIAIIACETFERALETLIKDDPDIAHKEYLEFGLHTYPQELKRVVVEKVNSLEGEVDAVLLGYGICNSLQGITEALKGPPIQLVGDDCIAVLLTPEEYDRERKKCAGTMYHTPYFAKMNREWFQQRLEEEMPNFEELGVDIDWYLGKLFDGYSRVLFIDDGLDGNKESEEMSRRFADDLHLRHECRCGTFELLGTGLALTKELARAQTGGKVDMPVRSDPSVAPSSDVAVNAVRVDGE
jgi:hypothetical protein